MLDEEEDRRQELMSRLIVECSTGNNVEVLDTSTCMSQRETSFESLNGLVWSRCHKHKHHGAKVVHCAVASGVLQFNCGATSREKIMAELSIPGGSMTKKASEAFPRLIYEQQRKRRKGVNGRTYFPLEGKKH